MILKGAVFSEDRKYRYQLWRIHDESLPIAMCIGLNPSTANETKTDPTITRLYETLPALGFGGFYMMNLFGLISSDPKDIRTSTNPIGDNDEHLRAIAAKTQQVIFCWGNFPQANYRVPLMKSMFPCAKCFGKNKNGSPWHPLAMMYAGIKPSETFLSDY